MRRGTANITACIAALSLAAPAAAQDGEKREPPRHHHRDRGDGLGGLVVGALIVGGLFAIDAVKSRPDYAMDMDDDDDGPELVAELAQARCAEAIEAEGRKYAPVAWVSSVDEYWAIGRRWTIKGKVELARTESDPTPSGYKFRCALKPNQAPRISIAGLTPAETADTAGSDSTLHEADGPVQRRDSQTRIASVTQE